MRDVALLAILINRVHGRRTFCSERMQLERARRCVERGVHETVRSGVRIAMTCDTGFRIVPLRARHFCECGRGMLRGQFAGVDEFGTERSA